MQSVAQRLTAGQQGLHQHAAAWPLQLAPRPVYVAKGAHAAASALSTAPAAGDADATAEEEPQQNRHSNNAHLLEVEQEALDVLEWPSLSRQVARLCGTIMAVQRLVNGGLPVGCSYEDSQLMLQQTQEAWDLDLSVHGVYDLSPALQALQTPGAYLNAKQLEGIGSSLQAALDIKARVTAANSSDSSQALYPALAAIAAGISDKEAALLNAIRTCIKLGSVSDEASEELASVRAERRDNADKLRTLVETTARGLYEKGASDSRSVTIIRDRYCVGIKAGRQSDLPKGSVKLGSSQTGATMYYEPSPAIPLNNAAAMLAGKEAQEEAAVLVMLSRMVSLRAKGIHQLLEAITQLDIIAAKAKHARIFGGVRPTITPAQHPSQLHSQHSSQHTSQHSSQHSSQHLSQHDLVRGGSQEQHSHGHDHHSMIWIPGAKHPLLFERALPEPLPEPPSLDDNRFDRNFAAPPAWEARRSVLEPQGTSNGAHQAAPLPKALDLRVPGAKQVVAITGPNTGGKTVTLKTIGLMALMARAGMFVPTQSTDTTPHVAWFNRVLADIGDAQSLQQNLSTFSGHIRRIKQVLAAADAGSLVLLDEVGSGTDPVEGAALARAILDKLANIAALTVATTHHAELKLVANEDGRYTNVSMEFNVSSLRPTYRLMWGEVGASNALDIARSLGFDSAVVSEAEEVARTTFEAQEDRAARLAATAESLMKQLQDAHIELQQSAARRQAEEEAVAQLKDSIIQAQDRYEKLGRAPRLILREVQRMEAAMHDVINAYAAGRGSREQVDEQLRLLESKCQNKLAALNNLAALGDAVAEVGDLVVVPSKHGEDQRFTVVAVTDTKNGKEAMLRPMGGALATLEFATLSMGSSRSRNKGGETVRAALSEHDSSKAFSVVSNWTYTSTTPDRPAHQITIVHTALQPEHKGTHQAQDDTPPDDAWSSCGRLAKGGAICLVCLLLAHVQLGFSAIIQCKWGIGVGMHALPAARDAPAGRHLLRTHPHLDKEEARPPLGAWPNFEPGVDKPTQVAAPEPTWEMLHTKNIIVGDASDATEISEYDRIKDNQQFGGGGAASITGVTDTT